jgi:hypothetical protein
MLLSGFTPPQADRNSQRGTTANNEFERPQAKKRLSLTEWTESDKLKKFAQKR